MESVTSSISKEDYINIYILHIMLRPMKGWLCIKHSMGIKNTGYDLNLCFLRR